MLKTRLSGLIAAALTPLHEDGSLDLDGLGPMVDQLIDSGISGLYVCGSTGEGMSLTCDERKSVVEAFVQAASKRIPIIVQVGHNSLADARDLAAHAVSAGADMISATCPSYFKVNDAPKLVDCMQEIASGAEGLPFYYYHIPSLTGSQINVIEFLKRGGDQIPNLVGLKYTNTLLHEFQSCLRLDDGRFDVVWGCDEMLLGGWATGAKAAIGSTYNVAAPLYRRVIEAFEAGDIDAARDLQYLSVKMVEVMIPFSVMPALKQMMQMLGMPGGTCRLPLTGLTDTQTADLHSQLDAIGYFDWCGHKQVGSK